MKNMELNNLKDNYELYLLEFKVIYPKLKALSYQDWKVEEEFKNWLQRYARKAG